MSSIAKISILFLLTIYLSSCYAGLKGTAQLTYFESYPRCCRGNSNYDASVSRDECDKYNGCTWAGQFAGYSDKKTLTWVKSNSLIAFYDESDKDGKNWSSKYAKKKIRLTKNGKTFNATIADTCANSDCSGCCTRNSKGGYLVDIEYYTALSKLGSLGAASGTIQFEIL